MKKNDLFFTIFIILLFIPFFISKEIYNFYSTFNAEHGMIISFIKFAILATIGESIGLRIKTGKYNQPGFGLIPRAIIWGVFGLWIKLAFVVFAKGVPNFLVFLGMNNAIDVMSGDFTLAKLLVAFCISVVMNVLFSPVFMTFHKITDTHITNNNGKLKTLFTPIKMGKIIVNLNWQVQWDFVIKRTIPLFWIPAHTITFCLPQEFQILFAAILGIVLGIFLSIATIKGK